MKRFLVLAGMLAITACSTLAVKGRDAFTAQAFTRSATFNMPYQALFSCFSDRGRAAASGQAGWSGTSPQSVVAPDLRVAEFKEVFQDEWTTLVRFEQTTNGTTLVTAWDVLDYNLDYNWQAVTECAQS